MCLVDILLDNPNKKQLTVQKAKIESDKNLVEVIAKKYDMLKYIKKDKDPNFVDSYEYDQFKHENGKGKVEKIKINASI